MERAMRGGEGLDSHLDMPVNNHSREPVERKVELEVLGIPFANNSRPMWIYDRETFAFLEVNDAAIQEYGFSSQEFLTMSLLDIRPPEDVPKFLEQARLGQRSTAEEWRHKKKDGKVFPVVVTSWQLTFRGRPAELVLARRDSFGR
ncbi:MAG TPA: PAS domain-containing protein [Terriglobales bacterium]|nr:PAS domain-containing protein [Terriglobales bacterium]